MAATGDQAINDLSIRQVLAFHSYDTVNSAKPGALASGMHHCNFRRPHSATSYRAPASGLSFDGNNLERNYIQAPDSRGTGPSDEATCTGTRARAPVLPENSRCCFVLAENINMDTACRENVQVRGKRLDERQDSRAK